jgi:hypothetical protein
MLTQKKYTIYILVFLLITIGWLEDRHLQAMLDEALVSSKAMPLSQYPEFVSAKLLPLAQFVENFQIKNGRLPTNEEFEEWSNDHFSQQGAWYYYEKPIFMNQWGIPGKDFVVGAWRGEWIEYYQSWDKKSFAIGTH